MPKKKIKLTHRKQRSVLSDMLPFEVPPTFSNRGFYQFLRNYEVEIVDNRVRWVCEDGKLDCVISILFGEKDNSTISTETKIEWGKKKTFRSLPLKSCEMVTIPFNFRIAHRNDGRILTVIHPRNQIDVSCFYARHSGLLTHYSSLGPFSIRHPVSVSRFAYFKDKLHEKKLENIPSGIEEEAHEYEQLGSYFVYRKYRNIHQFFESYKYHRCEKKYEVMVRADVSKCFDSIYTHSLSWAILGKNQTKYYLEQSKSTFGGKFDALMQRLNYQETNGIVIGPEFSRIFAEVILQSVDLSLEEKLKENFNLIHKKDYEIFRYVDDYFIFYNNPECYSQILDTLQECLKAMKLNVNTAKVVKYEKPIITEITIAKELVSNILNENFSPELIEKFPATEDQPALIELSCPINANRLITQYKSALKNSGVNYEDLLNYTLAILENKTDKLLKLYLKASHNAQNSQRFIKTILAIIEFSFFIYSASPKVNHTIRLCRIIANTTKFLNKNVIDYDLKHQFFKYVHDNILQQLEKNTMHVYREIESLYLLLALVEIGREYWLPETVLAKYFMLKLEGNNYVRKTPLNYFSLTVLLSYIKNKKRYQRIKEFIEHSAIIKLEKETNYNSQHTEAFITFLDFITCPYISPTTKETLGTIYGLSEEALNSVKSSNDYWFTAWDNKFDLAKSLDDKRSREVY